jgi:alpha-galactosidase
VRPAPLAIAVLLAGFSLSVVHSLNNGVGQTPAMGWNSWNFFRCDINETLIKEVADAIVSSGLRDVGYKYVNVGKSCASC